jgi:parallel beta-helix repeat protein
MDCDFISIQSAIDDTDTQPGDVIFITDPIHSEAGIVVNKDVVIHGQGINQTIIQAHDGSAKNAPDRVFLVPPETTAEIRAMTIQNGNPHDLLRYGGGVLNQGTLTLSHVLIRYNLADCGGGVVNQGGTLNIEYSTISSNEADGIAPPGLECGSGGGIKLVEDGTLTMTNSTLSRNKAKKNGGGIHVSCKSEAALSNCTISDNKAGRVGGGLSIGGQVSLTHCTIAGNMANGISPFRSINSKAGGGIANSGVLNMENTIIANHIKARGDCVLRSSGRIDVNTNNLIEDGSCNPTYSGDPKLISLGDNGGANQTHMLQPDSLALDAISANDCVLDIDQRGQPRPVGQISGETPCDIGAVEMNEN